MLRRSAVIFIITNILSVTLTLAQEAPIPGTTVAQKAVLFEEDFADPVGKRFAGSVIWRTETVTRAGQPPELAIRAEVEVPLKLAMTWWLRRNTDKGLPATHSVEIMFKLPANLTSGGSISSVPGILMKQAEQTSGVLLAGSPVKVTDGFFRVDLSSVDADKKRNLQELKNCSWFDIPMRYNNNHREIIAIEKGTPGDRVFSEAFAAWEPQKSLR